MTRRWPVALAVAAALALCGCGPAVPLELAMRQQEVDVKYGHPAPTPQPSPPTAAAHTGPFVFVPLVPTVEAHPESGATVVAPPPFKCATLSTLAVPKDEATALIAGPPPKGAYQMRSSGTYSLASSKGNLPAALGLIQPSPPMTGSNSVDGAYADYGLVTAYDTSRFWAFTFRLAENNAATPGVLLTSLHWKDPVRGNLDFVPDAPLQFLQTPVAIGNSWTAAGTDPIDQTSVELQGNIPKKEVVNACGIPLDSYQLHIAGNIASPTFQLTWTGDYDIGTQFGGLILAEHVNLTGPDRIQNTGDTYNYDESSTTNSVPTKPAP